MVTFHPVNPDSVPDDVLVHLHNAIARGEGNVTLGEVLQNARDGHGSIYQTMQNEKIVGALYVEPFGKLLNIVLLGGTSIRTWQKDLPVFLRKLLTELGIEHVCVLGRGGWHGIFSELKPLGTLYIASK